MRESMKNLTLDAGLFVENKIYNVACVKLLC
jgi:hypothetical protein